ncbi:Uncharacterised protein [Shigella sonnei]|nr:Uncharacterised protein [Shigella sonnei]
MILDDAAIAASSRINVFPSRSQFPDVLTIPPSQRLVNWRSATPCGENSAFIIGSNKCSEP